MAKGFARKLHALVIGIDHYAVPADGSAGYPTLHGCVHDAVRIAKLLVREVGLPILHLQLLLAPREGGGIFPSPTYENIVAAFGALAARIELGDSVWIHFSGHGGTAPTAFPELVGVTGHDEVLVPPDIARSDAPYLRDVEISFLLEQLVARGAFVTLALDCCHAAGVVRGEPRSVLEPRERSHRIVHWQRPLSSLVASRHELVASWRRFGAPWMKASGGGATTGRGAGFVTLAACRPHERAYEYSTEAGKPGGAFTWELIAAIREFGTRASARQYFDRVRSAMRSRFEGFQVPVLTGDQHRNPFDQEIENVQDADALTVLTVADQSLSLATGAAQGIAPGARFTIHPLSPADPRHCDVQPALIEISEIGGADAIARWLDPGTFAVHPGDRAVLATLAARRLPVYLLDDAGGDMHFGAIAQELRATVSPFLRWCAEGEELLRVELADSESLQMTFTQRAGSPPVLGQPPSLPAHETSPLQLLHRLERLARFHTVERLENRVSSSPLAEALRAELQELPRGFRPEHDDLRAIDDDPRAAGIAESRVQPGAWLNLRVENAGDRFLEIVVLDLCSSWAIEQIFPARGETLTLAPGTYENLPFQAQRSPGASIERHRLRIFATLDPVRWSWLELPPLDQPFSNARGASPTGPLELDLLALALGRRAHGVALQREARSSREWTVRDVMVEIEQADFPPRSL